MRQKQGISYPEGNVLHAPRVRFVVLLIDMTNFHIKNPKKTTSFRAPVVYLFEEQVHQKLYDLFAYFTNSLTVSYLGYRHEKRPRSQMRDSLSISFTLAASDCLSTTQVKTTKDGVQGQRLGTSIWCSLSERNSKKTRRSALEVSSETQDSRC